MSLKRSSRPADQSNKPQGSTTGGDRKRITNSSRELNRNEEQASPLGKDRAPEKLNQQSRNLDQSGRTSPKWPDISARQNNQGPYQGSMEERNQTTGSNIPGSEIADRSNPNAEQWKQTSQDQYPTLSKSSPTPKREIPKEQQSESMQVNWEKKAVSNKGMKQQHSDAGINRNKRMRSEVNDLDEE